MGVQLCVDFYPCHADGVAKSDLSLFNKFFKAHRRMRPGEFRRNAAFRHGRK